MRPNVTADEGKQVMAKLERVHARHRGVDDAADGQVSLLKFEWDLFQKFFEQEKHAPSSPFGVPQRMPHGTQLQAEATACGIRTEMFAVRHEQ